MAISRIRGLKYFGLSGALTLMGAVLALFLNPGAEAQNQTIFSDNFEDGNANGFSCFVGFAESGPGTLVERDNFFVNSGLCQAAGTTADPRFYYGYAPDPAADVPSIVIQLAGVGRLGF